MTDPQQDDKKGQVRPKSSSDTITIRITRDNNKKKNKKNKRKTRREKIRIIQNNINSTSQEQFMDTMKETTYNNKLGTKEKIQTYKKAIGERPLLEIRMGQQHLLGLLDTGSQVTTVTEEFYQQLIAPKLTPEQIQKSTDKLELFDLYAANNTSIPIARYLEIDITCLNITCLLYTSPSPRDRG